MEREITVKERWQSISLFSSLKLTRYKTELWYKTGYLELIISTMPRLHAKFTMCNTRDRWVTCTI